MVTEARPPDLAVTAPANGPELSVSTSEVAGGAVVCFRAAPADAAGLHALVDVGSGRFALPPLSRVTLARVDEPGEWEPPWMMKEKRRSSCCWSRLR